MNVGDLQRDSRVQKVLRDMNDSPHIIYQTDETLLISRHGRMKRVVLLSTPYYVYLLKHKDMSYYGRWANTHLSFRTVQNKLHITTDDFLPDSPESLADSRAPVLSAESVGGNEFHVVTLEGASSAAVLEVESWLRDVSASACLRSEILAAREECTGSSRRASASEDDEGGDGNGEKSGDDSETTSAALSQHAGGEATAAVRGGERTTGLFQTAPSRYLAVASLVDGEFTDYGALRNAYIRREEDVLLDDIASFIRENEGRVGRLCEQHYPAFLHAARQCLAVSEHDAELVGHELAHATARARASVAAMRGAAADLQLSRCVGRHVAETLALLRGARAVAALLAAAEAQRRRQRLIGAVVGLRRLVRAATAMAAYALGEFVLRQRVPEITRDVRTAAVQQLNAWLKVLREHARPVGGAALAWPGGARPGTVVKRIAADERSGEWWIEAEGVRAEIRRAPFAQKDALDAVVRGASVQTVFIELRCGAYFAAYYAKSRAQQAKLDLYDVPAARTDSTDGADTVAALEQYCATALGFLLIEDLVHHATHPHVQSAADVLAVWENISQALAERARRAAAALTADPHYTERMTEVLNLLRRFLNIAVEHVSSVPLSPLVLARVVEMMSDSIVSTWLQEACVEATQVVLGTTTATTLVPLTVSSAQEYTAYVERFALDRCRGLEIPVPLWPSDASGKQAHRTTGGGGGGRIVLPYASFVPAIGDIALRFLACCHCVMVTDAGAVVRQSELNNADELLLKYLSVLFRTVSELLQGQLASVPDAQGVVPLAVFVTSCTALRVVLSCVEQHFVLAWPGDYDGAKCRQRIGDPQLLAPSAALFEKAAQRGIERILCALMNETEERLRPTAEIAYWKRLVEVRKGGAPRAASDGKGLPEAMDFIIETIPKLAALLQAPVLRSVAGTVITQAALMAQSNIETAVHGGCRVAGEKDFANMRACVKEVQLFTAALTPKWLRRIEAQLAGLAAAQRFPLRPQQLAEELMQSIARREREIAAERSRAARFEGEGSTVT